MILTLRSQLLMDDTLHIGYGNSDWLILIVYVRIQTGNVCNQCDLSIKLDAFAELELYALISICFL